jgi:hypothetical protein
VNANAFASEDGLRWGPLVRGAHPTGGQPFYKCLAPESAFGPVLWSQVQWRAAQRGSTYRRIFDEAFWIEPKKKPRKTSKTSKKEK